MATSGYKFSKSQIDKVGDSIRNQAQDTAEYAVAIEQLNLWREAHGAPMDHYYDICVELARDVNRDIIIAQRLKRLPTILDKLQRFTDMRLSRMQDVGGVRVIVKDMSELARVEELLLKLPNLNRNRDYISQPKTSGYRGKHFIFENNNMLIEIQLRTYLQHLWATSVETMDIFLGTSMKTQPHANYWQTFFRQVSSIFAFAEDSPALAVHHSLDTESLCRQLYQNIARHDILNKIQTYAYTSVIREYKADRAYYAVINLQTPASLRGATVSVNYFREEQYEDAFQEYEKLERDTTTNTVLVAVSDLKGLRSAYPNYFVDLHNFIRRINDILDFSIKKK